MKRIYKLTPVSIYNIPGLESWLEDMARKGLHVKHCGSLFCSFEEGPPRSVRCRVEPCRVKGSEAPKPMLELFQDFGWELVCETSLDLLLFSTQDLDAPELHSDPQLQGELWNKLYRAKRRHFWGSLLYTMFFTALFLGQIALSHLYLPLQLALFAPFLLALLVFALLEIRVNWIDLRLLSRIVRQLAEGVPLDHRTAYPKRRRITLVMYVFWAVLFLLWALLLFGEQGSASHPIETLTSFPILSLAEVEGEGYTSRSLLVPQTYDAENRQFRYQDYGNYFQRTRFSPGSAQWRVVQSGWDAQGEEAMLSIERYDLLTPLFTAEMARGLLDHALAQRAGSWTTEALPHEGTGLLLLARPVEGETCFTAASRGDKIVLVEYSGRQDLTRWLDEIAAMAG